jgi:hypothetical protein
VIILAETEHYRIIRNGTQTAVERRLDDGSWDLVCGSAWEPMIELAEMIHRMQRRNVDMKRPVSLEALCHFKASWINWLDMSLRTSGSCNRETQDSSETFQDVADGYLEGLRHLLGLDR